MYLIMPRKSTKKLFRRGSDQKYIKPIQAPRYKHEISKPLINFHLPYTGAFFLMFVIFSLTLLMPQLFKYTLPLVNSLISSIELPSIKLPHAALPETFYLPQITINIPQIALPQINVPSVVLPDLGKIIQPVILSVINLINIGLNIIIMAAKLLNPLPAISALAGFAGNLNIIYFNFLTTSLNIVTFLADFFDPRPGLIVISSVSKGLIYTTALLISGLLIRTLEFINPLPGVLNTWRIEIAVVMQLAVYLSALITMTFNGATQILIFTANILWTIVNFIINIFIAVFNFIKNIIDSVHNFIKYQINIVNKTITAGLLFIKPYIIFLANSFKQTFNDLSFGINDLMHTSRNLVDAYNKNPH